jgi:hypothetical protein
MLWFNMVPVSVPVFLRWGRSWKRRLGSHFCFTINGRRVAYCYIRKNGCSAFKRLMLDVAGGERDDEQPITTLSRHFGARSLDEVRRADHRILVLRDPYARLVSLFRNKFIMRDGAEDILRDFAAVTGSDALCATFEGFVRDYVAKHPSDPHCWAITDHLLPVDYDVVIPLEELGQAMSATLGEAVAKRYFNTPLNSSHDRLEHRPGAWAVTASKLREAWELTSIMADGGSFEDQDLRVLVEWLFAKDYRMISQCEIKREFRPASP